MENKPTKDKLIFEEQLKNPNFLRQFIRVGNDPMPHLLMSIADKNLECVKVCLEMVGESQNLNMPLLVALKGENTEIKLAVLRAFNKRQNKASKPDFVATHDDKKPSRDSQNKR